MQPSTPIADRMLRGAVRAAPGLTLALPTLPLAFGLAGTILPSLGYLPALGGDTPSFRHFADLARQPAIASSVLLSLSIGVVTTAISLAVVMFFIAGFAGGRAFGVVQH
ncbi:MAG: ABC transporter permease, partial [Pseudaminobacter sp.]|nr:ABC transporter permease [Pseudaminobacter sp.]